MLAKSEALPTDSIAHEEVCIWGAPPVEQMQQNSCVKVMAASGSGESCVPAGHMLVAINAGTFVERRLSGGDKKGGKQS